MDAVRIEHAPGRFVARLDGTEAVRRGDVLDIQSTYTPPEQRCTIRVSRVQHHQGYGPFEVRKSVSPNELDAAIAEGWARV